MIETRRLIIRPLSANEMKKLLESPEELAGELGLSPSYSLVDTETREAIVNDLFPNLTDPGKDPLFYTMWIVIEKQEKAIIGGFCFHGEPDAGGEAEIGYGIDEEYRNKGYMTETLIGIIHWAKGHDKVKALRAETDPWNFPSVRALEKNGFRPVGKTGMGVLRLDLGKQA